MAECGDLQYNLIGFNSLFDLKDAKILRAQINSIDRPANTADITLLDYCEEVAEVPLTDVEFFYHCEDSTGTVEDLAKGHKAFVDDDFVYTIYIKQRGDVPASFYIIGHVDIRLTARCTLYEYYIMTVWLPDDGEGVPGACVTIFDVSSGAVLDIESFQNVDDGSPAKPASIPCVRNAAFNAWYNYNFNQVAKPASPMFNVYPLQDQVIQNEDVFSVISEEPHCSDPRDTHSRLTRPYQNQGVFHVIDYFYHYEGVLPKPYPWLEACPYSYSDIQYITVATSGDSVLGWEFVDQSSNSTYTVSLRLNFNSDTKQNTTNIPPTSIHQHYHFESLLIYPFDLADLTSTNGNGLTVFSQDYTDGLADIPNWSYANIGGVYNGQLSSGGRPTAASNHEGWYGVYGAFRYALDTNEYVPRAFAFVATLRDVTGPIDGDHPMTTERWLRAIDTQRSIALGNTLVQLDAYHFAYMQSGVWNGGGQQELIEFPCQKKEPI